MFFKVQQERKRREKGQIGSEISLYIERKFVAVIEG